MHRERRVDRVHPRLAKLRREACAPVDRRSAAPRRRSRRGTALRARRRAGAGPASRRFDVARARTRPPGRSQTTSCRPPAAAGWVGCLPANTSGRRAIASATGTAIGTIATGIANSNGTNASCVADREPERGVEAHARREHQHQQAQTAPGSESQTCVAVGSTTAPSTATANPPPTTISGSALARGHARLGRAKRVGEQLLLLEARLQRHVASVSTESRPALDRDPSARRPDPAARTSVQIHGSKDRSRTRARPMDPSKPITEKGKPGASRGRKARGLTTV